MSRRWVGSSEARRARSIEVGSVIELGHVDDVDELAQLLDEPQGFLSLDASLEREAEPQGGGEEDEKFEPGMEPLEYLGDRAELPPRVDVTGEIPERRRPPPIARPERIRIA